MRICLAAILLTLPPIAALSGEDPSKNQIVIEENPEKIIVSNGALRVEFGLSRKQVGRITAIQLAGKEYLSPSGGAYIRSFGIPMTDGQPTPNKKESKGLKHKWSHKVIREKDYTEIRFSEKATPQWPMSTDIGWIFRNNEPGIYYYVSYHHPAELPDVKLQQTRMAIMVATHAFQKARVDNDRVYDVVPIDQWRGHRPIMDATYLLDNGQIITKYSWSTRKENQRFYGYAGRGMGIFQHFPSMEHVNGGANKQSNTIHHTPDGPIALNVMSSSHYGAGMTDIQGEWKKLYGPFFLSLTGKPTWQENIETAERKQDELEKAWPLQWFKHPQYAVNRAHVEGTVRINTKPASNALVLLSTQQADSMSETLNHGLGPMYWTRSDAQGQFSIPHIAPGEYYVYVNQPGVFGDFHSSLDAPYTLTAGQTKDIGRLDFTENPFGTELWRIGIPDRDSAEFRGAQNNGFRPFGGLWRLKETYGGDNPVFKVGFSDPAKDFYYAHPISLNSLQDYVDLVQERTSTDYRAFTLVPERIIEFPLPTHPEGQYLLTVALAGNRGSNLSLFLNDHHVEDFSVPREGGGGIRSGSYGLGGAWRILLPIEHLKKGVNRIRICHKKGLVLRDTPTPEKGDRKGGNTNARSRLKGSLFTAVLYDAIKLEHQPE